MKMIERGTCLRFRERTTESDYLDFYYGEILNLHEIKNKLNLGPHGVCMSPVGRQGKV